MHSEALSIIKSMEISDKPKHDPSASALLWVWTHLCFHSMEECTSNACLSFEKLVQAQQFINACHLLAQIFPYKHIQYTTLLDNNKYVLFDWNNADWHHQPVLEFMVILIGVSSRLNILQIAEQHFDSSQCSAKTLEIMAIFRSI